MTIRYKETIWYPRAEEDCPRKERQSRGFDLDEEGIVVYI